MEFNVRFSRDFATITTVPKGYGKPGFLKRLPSVLAKRPRRLVDAFLGGDGPSSGTHTVEIVKNKNGAFVVGEISYGNRSGKKYDGPDEVAYKTKVLINRQNGIGIRLCFLPDDLVGKRVHVFTRR